MIPWQRWRFVRRHGEAYVFCRDAGPRRRLEYVWVPIDWFWGHE